MHQNYYFLRQLSKALQQKVAGMELATCFSQQKNELILGFCNAAEEFYIKAALLPEGAYLAFPDEFQRARRNSVDLFTELIGKKVLEVIQHKNERGFHLLFKGGWILMFKMHGNRANLVLFDAEGQVADLFNKQLRHDWDIKLSEVHRSLAPTPQALEAARGEARVLYPTLGPLPLLYLKEQGYEQAELSKQWKMLQQVVSMLETPAAYYIISLNQQVRLSLLPMGTTLFTCTAPLEAANQFAREWTRVYYIERERAEILRHLHQKKQKTEAYIQKTEEKLNDLIMNSRYEEVANILMANLHQVPNRAKTVTLYDFYRDQPLEIKLKEDQSPQKNAENLYRKAKNQKIEVDRMQQTISAKWAVLEKTEQQLASLAATTDIRELRKYMKESGLHIEKQQDQVTMPFKKFEWQGFDILVGKNASANDELTQRYAHKDDLWLHARDVAGSHVIIKHKSGQPFPQPVLEKAAQLAAYYSKRKSDTLCPVIYTPKKWVRKPKGSPPGAVSIDKESVLLVTPKAFDDTSL
jgi:predicted ribosome quality control (RQC) complex YloA/Tae2 family protein